MVARNLSAARVAVEGRRSDWLGGITFGALMRRCE